MKCEEVMKKTVESVSPEHSVLTAAQRMRHQNVGFLPVCNENKQVLGTITDRDIVLRLVAENQPATLPVRKVMTREVIACRPRDPISRAEQLMSQHQKSRIMCTDDDGRLMGIISLSDIAQRDTGRGARVLRDVSMREARAQTHVR